MQLEALTLPLRTDSSAFNTGIAAASAGVAALVAGMGLAIKATFAWAGDLDKLGDVMGGTNKDLAALNFIARKSGVSVDTLAKGTVILSKGLIKANGELDTIGKELKDWGINVLDANGGLKDQTTLMGDIADKYSQFSTQQEKVNFLTGVFGKSGADLIDFFDTLAAEGGIDKVAEKVEALGLAIDPNRYEQFNRNLEELKLIGLSLAVGFTEAVMPALESFLGWLATVAQSPKFKEIKAKVLDLFNFGGDEADFDNRGGSGNPFGQKLQSLLSTLDSDLAGWLEGLEWEESGNAFGVWIGNVLTNGLEGEGGLPKFVVALTDGLEQGLLAAMGATSWDNAAQIFVGGMSVVEADTTAAIRQWGINSLNAFTAEITSWIVAIDQKLRDIAKTFYNRALAWGQQMIAGLQSGKGELLEYLQGQVDEINAILKKIITSFTLTFGAVQSGSSGGSGNHGNTGNHSGNNTGVTAGTIGGRASGGPVIGGQSYNVSEFFQPERFTPNVSGRVDPMRNDRQQTVRIIEEDINRIARVIATETVKAMNSA